MKIARFLLVSIPIMLSCLVVPLKADDPGIPDTVRLTGATLYVGQSVPITVSVINDELIGGFSLGFELSNLSGGFARFDSVVYVGRMADPTVLALRNINTLYVNGATPDTFAIGGISVGYDNPLPPGSTPVAKCYLTGLSVGDMTIDSSFFYPSGAFILVKLPSSTTIYPKFVGSVVSVLGALQHQKPEIILASQPYRIVAGTALNLPVSSSSSSGLPVTLEFVGINGLDDQSLVPQPLGQFDGGNPGILSWAPSLSDIGVWTAKFHSCDGSECSDKAAEIQVVASGDFLTTFLISSIPNSCEATGIIHGDFDSDGYPELAMTGLTRFDSRSWEYYHLTTGGELQRQFKVTDGAPKGGILVGYLNGCQYLDLTMSTFKSTGWIGYTYLGRGDNSFDPPIETGGTNSRGSVLGEFNGDNYLDVASVWYDGVSVYAGNSQGTFSFLRKISPPDSSLSINSADFNHDGFDDLAIGTTSGLDIYLCDGQGHFTRSYAYTQVYGSRDVVVTNAGSDFNGDGIFDLCISTPSVGGAQSQLMAYLGNGNGSFSQHVIRTVNGQVFGNCVADFNGDGKLDIAFVNGAKQYVSILFGDGDGSFANEIRYSIPWPDPSRIDCFDIDLDGDIDIVVAANGVAADNTLFLLKNETNPSGFIRQNLTINAFDNANVELASPSGKILSDLVNTMPASSYYKRNLDQNALMDDYLSLSLIEEGKYTLRALPKPNVAPGQSFDLEFSVGTEKFRLAENAPMTPAGYTFDIYPGSQTAVTPRPGKFTNANPPTFTWQGSGSFDFQFSNDIGFSNLLANVTVTTNSYKPANALAGPDSAIYYWRVKPHTQPTFKSIYSLNISDNATAVAEDANSSALPLNFNLGQNYPNPFNPATAISYTIASRAFVSIEVFNLLGQQIATLVNETKMPGAYTARWDGKDMRGSSVPSGIYFYRLRAGDFVESKRMILLK